MNVELSLTDMLEQLSAPERIGAVRGIRRGLERESLRITPEGRLSQREHPNVLGAALTHPNITTDYAESLMEFITPVSDSMETMLAQLADIHRYSAQHLCDERLWPMSMPCFINDEETIRLAQYGTSNIGRMKNLYRQGLHHRYGSLMQVISGVHFNFSMPDSFWSEWQELRGVRCQCKRFISDGYMALIRNVYRYGWLIPYLFGASPAICSSFLQGRQTGLPFEKLGRGTLYLPYATSLRLSDLGYTNKAQSSLGINHDNLDSYLISVRRALRTRSEEFAALGVKVNGEYRQLNDNILQLENELYAPIRPKRTPRAGERTLSALEHRGIEYIELRTLDINPFTPLGVDIQQLRFLDLFLVWCLLKPSPLLLAEEIQRNRHNLTRVVLEGRRPGLQLMTEQGERSLQEWGEQLFDELNQVAQLLDRTYGRVQYQITLQAEREKLRDPDKTLSARLLGHLQRYDLDNGAFGRELAEKYRQQLRAEELTFWDGAYFADEAHASLVKQAELEATDHLSFDEFLAGYLAH
ncbi:glutamate--cysteine ligase [Pseudaeromonas sharmana]|uniref:Glutamate--cysteine ligase n=1 Tax=Pseudaeromonas sharmana TaxID=328412 RepID=A0ABV8CLZ0_9GAMM